MKTTLNTDANYSINGKNFYAVEFYSVDQDGYAIDYGLDYTYFESEQEAINYINNFNK
jgi:hypothetical protein